LVWVRRCDMSMHGDLRFFRCFQCTSAKCVCVFPALPGVASDDNSPCDRQTVAFRPPHLSQEVPLRTLLDPPLQQRLVLLSAVPSHPIPSPPARALNVLSCASREQSRGWSWGGGVRTLTRIRRAARKPTSSVCSLGSSGLGLPCWSPGAKAQKPSSKSRYR